MKCGIWQVVSAPEELQQCGYELDHATYFRATNQPLLLAAFWLSQAYRQKTSPGLLHFPNSDAVLKKARSNVRLNGSDLEEALQLLVFRKRQRSFLKVHSATHALQLVILFCFPDFAQCCIALQGMQHLNIFSQNPRFHSNFEDVMLISIFFHM